MQVNNVVSFKGEQAAAQSVVSRVLTASERYKLNEELKKDLVRIMPAPIKFLTKMKNFSGEVPNIIINAIGTGLVAPIFIKHNCFSKTDEDTRTYSALRQPVSAVLAVLTQAGLVIPVDMVINRMCNEGEFSNPNFNKKTFQDVDYIAKQLKKTNPKATKEELKELAKLEQMKQLDTLVEQLEKGGHIKVYKDGKRVMLEESGLRELLDKTANSMVKDIEENIKRYESEKITKQVQRGIYLKDNKSAVDSILAEISAKVNDAKTAEEAKEWLIAKAKEMKKANKPGELITIVKDIAQRPDLKTIKEKITDVSEKCAAFAKYENNEMVRATVHAEILADIAELEIEKSVLKNIAEKSKDGKSSIKELLEKGGTLKKSSFSYEVIQKHIADIAANIKCKKQIVGLGVSLAILPVTCCMLNYIYPRFVEAFFPKLVKKPKTPDQFVKTHIDTQRQDSKEVK